MIDYNLREKSSMNIESKKISINTPAKAVYDFVSSFNNFSRLVPSQIEGWQSTDDTCSFKVGGFMQIQLRMAEKTPYSKVVVAPDMQTASSFPFQLIVSMDEKNGSTDVVVSIKIEGNPMMLMMVKGKIKPALDSLVEQLKYFVENKN
jgi:carbon monoxide dehydrogenase subunit G